MLAYMFSYYGISGGFFFSLFNYFIIGWAAPIDAFYMQSFGVWLSILFVFPVCGNLAYSILQYRLGRQGFIAAVVENVTWIPFL